jgi:hypothetical protein
MDIIASQNSGPPLRVSLDIASRALSGPDADTARAMLVGWPGVGLLYGGTQPVKAPDPLGSLHDFAVLLATNCYIPPDDLADLLPEAEDVPAGAVA